MSLIDNCLEYSQTLNSSVCTLCNSSYYTSGNSCISRSNSTIENCDELNPSRDNCITCQTGYTGRIGDETSGFSTCVEEIENCIEYETSNTLTCKRCKDLYYLSENNLCSLGTIDRCLTYTEGVGNMECELCESNFYLNNSNQCQS